MKTRDRLIEIEITLVHETDKAWLVESDVGAAWIPKALAEIEVGDPGSRPPQLAILTLPERLAVDKGIV